MGIPFRFIEESEDFDILSMSLVDRTTQGLIVIARSEDMPAWAAKADSLVSVSDRLGTEDIWLHPKAGPDRPPAFWSLTMYNSTQACAQNPINRTPSAATSTS